MRTYPEAALAEIEAGTAIVAGAVAIYSDPPLLIWGGYGMLPIAGEEYIGVGDKLIGQATSAALGGAAQNITLSLSGVDPDTLPLLDADALRAAPVVIWRCIFDGSGRVLLDAQPYQRGRVDEVPTEDTVGGEAIISVSIEGAARGLGRKGGRLRSDADQRLIKASDGGMKHVSYAGEKMIYWGGAIPSTGGQAIGGSIDAASGGRRLTS